jgi:hypothetical protein
MRLPNEDRYLLPIIAAIMAAGGELMSTFDTT